MALERVLVHVLAELHDEAAVLRHFDITVEGKGEDHDGRLLRLLRRGRRRLDVGGGAGRRREQDADGLDVGDAADRLRLADDLDPLAGVALEAGIELPPRALGFPARDPDGVEVVFDDPVRAGALGAHGQVAVEVLPAELPHHADHLAVALARHPHELLERDLGRLDVPRRLLLRRAGEAPELHAVGNLRSGLRLADLEEHARDLHVPAHHLQRLLLPFRRHLAHGEDADLVQEAAQQVGPLLRFEAELETAVGVDGAVRVGHGLLDEVVHGHVHGLAVQGVVPAHVVSGRDLRGDGPGEGQGTRQRQEGGQGAGTHGSSIGSTAIAPSSVDGPLSRR